MLDSTRTARASLQRPLFDYCKEKIPGICICFISTEELDTVWSKLEVRFSSVSTLPGTRSFHPFIPFSENIMAAKHGSRDQSYALEFGLMLDINAKGKISGPKVSDLVLCSYDKYWIRNMMMFK